MTAQRPLVILDDGQIAQLPVEDVVVVALGAIEEYVEGNLATLPVTDHDTNSLLGKILKEIRIMNMHLAVITGEKISLADLEG